MFAKQKERINGKDAIVVTGLGKYGLSYTLECGQAFRYELIEKTEDYIEYMTVIGEHIITVVQREAGELIFYDPWDEEYEAAVSKYFRFDVSFEEIRGDVLSHTDSEWLTRAAESAKGVVILKQEPWETLFSFIISQNNNIPRIRKIIRSICTEYGENLAVKENRTACPMGKGCVPGCEKCAECGICYSFPTPRAVLDYPEGLLPSKPGFRYKYLMDAADKVYSGEVDLEKIEAVASYDHTMEELKRIKGVGDKVASCVALFGLSNLEAFPIDVWMKRAIDEYFDGNLDPQSLGKYAGVAQQYIFHYIRNLQEKGK